MPLPNPELSSAPATAVPDMAALLDQPGGFERAIKAVKARASGGGMELAEYAKFATHVREHAPMNLLVWGLGGRRADAVRSVRGVPVSVMRPL